MSERWVKDPSKWTAEWTEPVEVDVQLPRVKDGVPIDRLPLSNFLEAEAKAAARKSLTRALLEESVTLELDSTSLAQDPLKPLPDTSQSPRETVKQPRLVSEVSRPQKKLAFWELLRAIEKRDLQTIFEVRQSQFELLTRKEGGVTPLLHCLRLGKSHNDVATILTGAFSKWVNQLEDSEQPLSREKKLLATSIRTQLKLAINASIQTNQTELISSYLSVIVASSGDKWLREATQSVAVALRQGPAGKPCHLASSAIRSFATKELKALTVPGADAISSVEDYLANASADLLLMAAWANVPFGGDELPLWFFARDDRTYRVFVERVNEAQKSKDYQKMTKLLKSQIGVLVETLGSRAVGYREKFAALQGQLDQ